ncbi:MAG: Methyltransferase type 12 [Bacteroidetes bacterium]|nr:Methyltransferase type 12 [Bacteroidota bacterium]
MNLIEKATILHFHRHRLNIYGNGTFRALGWKSMESQAKRFEVIASACDLNNKSILDVGCGYGDLKEYLDERFTNFHYTGIDQQPKFIAEAKQVYANKPDTYFFQTDFTQVQFPKVDYKVASGALSYRSSNSRFVFEMIAKMYSAANQGVAFNLFNAETFPEHPILMGHNIKEVETFCHTLCPQVQVITGYFDDDYTFILEHF